MEAEWIEVTDDGGKEWIINSRYIEAIKFCDGWATICLNSDNGVLVDDTAMVRELRTWCRVHRHAAP